VEVGKSLAASYCTKLLADLGAEVYKVERPGGEALRQVPPLDDHGGEATSGLFQYLNANKRAAFCDLHSPDSVAKIGELLTGADVLVEDYGPGRMERLGLGPDVLGSRNSGLVYVRISNYGLTGPWAHRVASSLVLQAETGMAIRLGEAEGVPTSIMGHLDDYIGGTFAAAAALVGSWRASQTGEGTIADVSLFETLLYSLSPADVLEEFLANHGMAMPQRQRSSPGFVACRDGMVCVSTLTGQNWQDLCLLIRCEDWVERMKDIQNDGPARTEFLEALASWTRTLDCAQVIEILQACHIAAATATDGRSMLEQPVYSARGFYIAQPDAAFVRPSAPYRLSETPVGLRNGAPRLSDGGELPDWDHRIDRRNIAAGDADPLPLAGLKVIDLTHFLAGGHLCESLAALGAHVIKIESPRRPDGYRFVGTYPDMGEQWWELSPLWQAQNFGKESLGLDLSTDEGRDLLAQLISGADVVAENFTPRVMEGFGFGYGVVRRLNPGIIMVRMPAFGLEGPCRDHVGFAYSIEQVAGLAQNGPEDGPLVQPAGIVDIVNGQHALVATLAALRHRDETKAGQLVEVSQVETVACLTADQVIEYQLTGKCRQRIGNRSNASAPQGTYPARDGRWISLTVETDEQWRMLCDVIDAPVSVSHLSFKERVDAHDELDAVISARTMQRSAPEIVAQLQTAGLPAGVLALLPELRDNPQLAAREYYEQTCYPDEGDRRRSRLPVLFDFGKLTPGRSPRLGEHNVQILEELGFDRERIDSLCRNGIVFAGLQE